MDELKKVVGSWGKAFIATALATYMSVGLEPATILNAALAAVIPSVINWLNPNYERYGKIK